MTETSSKTGGSPDNFKSSKGFEKRVPRIDYLALLQKWGTLLIFVVIVVGSSLQSSDFFTERNIMNVLRQVSALGIMSVAMLLVVLTRGIDLSVGSVSALGGVVSAILVLEYSPATSVLAVLGVGALSGLAVGVCVAYFRLPAFVVSLAMMTIARGLAFIFSKGQPIIVGERGEAFTDFATGFFLGVPYPVIAMLTIFVLGAIVLNLSKFGRIVKAIGSNEEAVRLSGVHVQRYVAAVYVISGILAAMAGIISTGRAGVGAATINVGIELEVIAAVVIGGASLMGGKGGMFNTLLGVLVLGIIGNIMNLASVPGYSQQVFMGIIILAAVMLQQGAQIFRRP